MYSDRKTIGVLFLPPSDAYVRSFLYLLYTLIKLYYTKTLSDQASSLAPDWILLLRGPRIPVYSRDSTTTFHIHPSFHLSICTCGPSLMPCFLPSWSGPVAPWCFSCSDTTRGCSIFTPPLDTTDAPRRPELPTPSFCWWSPSSLFTYWIPLVLFISRFL